MSERDLQAHIKFRHAAKNDPVTGSTAASAVPSAEAIAAATAALVAENQNRKMARNMAPNFSQPPPANPVLNRGSNLITVPIQDNNPSDNYWAKFNQPPPNYYQRPPPSNSSYDQYAGNSNSRRTSSGYHRR